MSLNSNIFPLFNMTILILSDSIDIIYPKYGIPMVTKRRQNIFPFLVSGVTFPYPDKGSRKKNNDPYFEKENTETPPIYLLLGARKAGRFFRGGMRNSRHTMRLPAEQRSFSNLPAFLPLRS